MRPLLPPRRRAAGLTLVELMVTMIVAALVASSTFVFFVGQRRIYDQQMKTLNMQQNLWAAMEVITRNVRVAGMGMIGCIVPDPDGPAITQTGDPPPVTSATGTAPATGLRAFVGSGVTPPPGYGAANQTIRLAPMWIKNGGSNGPDSITVVYGTGTFGNFVDSFLGTTVLAAGSSNQIQVTAPATTDMFRQWEFMLLVSAQNPSPGDRGCSMFQITGIQTPVLQVTTAAPWNPTMPYPTGFAPSDYIAGTGQAGIRNFGALNWLLFYVQTTPTTDCPNGNCLMVTSFVKAYDAADNGPYPFLASPTPSVLAEGIEDMQVAYACDISPAGPPVGDGVLSEGTPTRATDEWLLNDSGDTPLLQPYSACNIPTAVRITLVARSTEPDVTIDKVALDNRLPAVEDRAAGAQDQFRRRVMTTVSYPRNRPESEGQ